jgi:hypothetical protein
MAHLLCGDAFVVWAVHHLVEVVLLQDARVVAYILYEDEAYATAAQRSRLQAHNAIAERRQRQHT